MKPGYYSFVFVIPGLAALGLFLGGYWVLLAPAVVFGLVPLGELVLPAPTDNPDEQEAQRRLQDWRYEAVIFAALPVQFALVGFFLFQIARGQFVGWELLGAILTLGLSCGGLGINIGHELGHRPGKRHQSAAKLLLGSSLYAHFFIEHNRGHHARVATPEDPASSRRGEWVQTFWLRSLVGGFLSAWQLEADRLIRRGRSPWTWDNEMIRLQCGQAVFLGVLWALVGAQATLAFSAAALVGALLLETVNYVEHYGLRRERNERGRWERVGPAHSWNSNCILGRLLLFELTRHSDHHAHPKRAYSQLRHFDEAPQLPTGYPGMILLALVPPLFHAVMNARLPAPQSVAPGRAA